MEMTTIRINMSSNHIRWEIQELEWPYAKITLTKTNRSFTRTAKQREKKSKIKKKAWLRSHVAIYLKHFLTKEI